MTSFLSDPVEIVTNSAKLVDFFDDMNNFRRIMPEQIEEWESDKESCTFIIKNLGKLGMKKDVEADPKMVRFLSSETSKVKFILVLHLKSITQSNQEVSFEILSEMNSFVEMMARRPLTNFVNILTTNLKKHFNT